jgi:hypothetical protein
MTPLSLAMALEDHVRETVDTFVTRVRRDLDAHVQTLTAELQRFAKDTQDTGRSELERAVSAARAEAEQSFHDRLETMRQEMLREMESRLAADRARLDDERSNVREERSGGLQRLLAAIRRIDEAATLSGILEALAKGAASENLRVAILLVEGSVLKTWGHYAFPPNALPVDMPIGQAGVLTAAVALRQTSFVRPVLETSAAATPAFMRVPVGHTGLVTPIVVAAEVVAVLYADDVDRTPAQEDAPAWTEEVELLVRHASVRLENVTTERTVEVLTRPA